MITTPSSTPWLSLLSSASMGAMQSLEIGHPREWASTSKAGRLPVASLWTSASVPALWRESCATTWWAMRLSASSTRSPRREAFLPWVGPARSTPSTGQRSRSLPSSRPTSWSGTCPRSCPRWTCPASPSRCGGRPTSSSRPRRARPLRRRGGSWASSTALAWASPSACRPTAPRTSRTPASSTSPCRTSWRPPTSATSWAPQPWPCSTRARPRSSRPRRPGSSTGSRPSRARSARGCWARRRRRASWTSCSAREPGAPARALSILRTCIVLPGAGARAGPGGAAGANA
mmetsp:Transcript_99560/g.290664  ORF Transcript_99560/g.290664 Transcript_99560/m.290664 type:complete len:289 (-) Transcript_99560:243-1109(-)